MINYLFIFNLLLASGDIRPPVKTPDEATRRYGTFVAGSYKLSDLSNAMATTSFMGHRLYVNKDLVLPLWFVQQGLKSAGLGHELTKFRGCYNPRHVRGVPGKPSAHAYGLACDFDHKPFSREFVGVWKRFGFKWGGDFCNRDYMHFTYSYEEGGCPYDWEAPEPVTRFLPSLTGE